MTTLDELAKAAPATRGPDAELVARERERFVWQLHATPRRLFRATKPRVAIAIALAATTVGVGVAAATGRLDLKTRKMLGIVDAQQKVSVALSSRTRLVLLSTPTPSLHNCVFLRRVTNERPVAGDLGCFLGAYGRLEPLTDVTLSVERVTPKRWAVYGEAPRGVDGVQVEFADGSRQSAAVQRGWYLMLARDLLTNAPRRVSALSGATVISTRAQPPAAQFDSGPASCQLGGKSHPAAATYDQRAYARRNPQKHLVAAGQPLPDLRWFFYIENRRGDPYLSVNYDMLDGQGIPSGGGGFTGGAALSGPMDASEGTVGDVAHAYAGSAPSDTACVLITDSLGRTTAIRPVNQRVFPKRAFWVVVLPATVDIAKGEAFDARGKRVGVLHLNGQLSSFA